MSRPMNDLQSQLGVRAVGEARVFLEAFHPGYQRGELLTLAMMLTIFARENGAALNLDRAAGGAPLTEEPR